MQDLKQIELEKQRKRNAFDQFSKINSQYWEERHFDPLTDTILVEGLFGESGPNYVIRVGTIAKALEKIKNCNLLVLLQTGSRREPYKSQVWRSFKMNDFIGIYDDVYNNFSYFKKLRIYFLAKIYYFWAKILIFFRKREALAKISFKGIKLGDILYDEIIKETPIEEHTINKITKKHKKFFIRLFVYFFTSKHIYKKYRPKYYVTTHTQYISYGLPARYFAYRGTIIIETTDDILFIHDDFSNPPKFHTAINRTIRNNLNRIYNDSSKLEEVKDSLKNRFSGKIEQIDVKMAYSNKKLYSETILRQTLGIKNDYPLVFIFAHIFADAPQGLSDKTLFADFYQWLAQTIEYIGNIQDVNWIVKPHPSAKAYGEVGEVEKLIQKTSKSHIFLCPEDFNTASVIKCAKAIITAQGTVGLEFSCMGIPIIISAKPFYAGFGFTYEPSSKKEYFRQLKNIRNIKSLSEDQIRTARSVYYSFFEIQNKDFSLIDTILKDKTWGVSGPIDVSGAFELMSQRLQNIDPKTRPLYNQIIETFR